MNIEPFEDFILVRPLKTKDPPSGIVLPDKVKNAMTLIIAEVLKVGPGRQLENGERRLMDVKVGDRVLFGNGIPKFPIAESGLWRYNGQKTAPLCLINVGHLLGTILDKDVELIPADELPASPED